MKSITRLAALAFVSAVTTACDGGPVFGTGEDCNDHPATERRVHAYDTQGRLSQLDIGMNGIPQVVFRYTYDDAGRRVESRAYPPEDLQTPVVIHRVEFDSAGGLARIEHLVHTGGVATVITRDAEGRPVRSEIHVLPATDTVAVDTASGVASMSDPTPLEGAGEDLLQPEPGQVATLWYPLERPDTLDDTTLPLQYRVLLANPDRVDITWSDVPGEPLRDTDGDGVVDAFAFLVVVATDKTREDRWDFNGDGVVDGRRLVTFGADGEPVESTDWDETVSPAQVDEHIVYGENETVTTTAKKVMTIVYEDGRRVLHTDDTDGDGVIDWEKTYEYDAKGRRTREVRDQDVDGRPDQIWTYTYDDAGRLVQEDMVEGSGDLCEAP
jgi:hypothetical protein